MRVMERGGVTTIRTMGMMGGRGSLSGVSFQDKFMDGWFWAL
jgi:hypothetical protein